MRKRSEYRIHSCFAIVLIICMMGVVLCGCGGQGVPNETKNDQTQPNSQLVVPDAPTDNVAESGQVIHYEFRDGAELESVVIADFDLKQQIVKVYALAGGMYEFETESQYVLDNGKLVISDVKDTVAYMTDEMKEAGVNTYFPEEMNGTFFADIVENENGAMLTLYFGSRDDMKNSTRLAEFTMSAADIQRISDSI